MKKLIVTLIAVFFAFASYAYSEYKVETEEDEYVSDAVFFEPVSTWDEVFAKAINLKKGRLIFYAGRDNAPQRIETTVMPVNTTNKKVYFKSSDITIATVDENGVVTPMNKVGNTTVEMQCGKAKSIMKISVVKGVEGVVMSQNEMTLYADMPVTAQLEALVFPADATIQDVKWSSSDETIAFVDKEGLVYPVGVGSAEIYAKTVDGGYSASCNVTVTTWEKPREEDSDVSYTDYDITLEEMAEKQMGASPTIFTTNAFPASEDDVLYYVNPENLTGGYGRYQFLDLSRSNDVDAETLDAYLSGKGSLSGMGRIFDEAADDNGLSEVYLVVHSCLETGNGFSELAQGVLYNDVVVYNMFGIGAIDADPVNEGAKYAYEQGWTSVEKAIRGGVDWISDNYINNMRYNQNTLYKMRWNPDNPAVHQYAADVAWADKQAESMGAMFGAFPSAKYSFDVPVFEGQSRVNLK